MSGHLGLLLAGLTAIGSAIGRLAESVDRYNEDETARQNHRTENERAKQAAEDARLEALLTLAAPFLPQPGQDVRDLFRDLAGTPPAAVDTDTDAPEGEVRKLLDAIDPAGDFPAPAAEVAAPTAQGKVKLSKPTAAQSRAMRAFAEATTESERNAARAELAKADAAAEQLRRRKEAEVGRMANVLATDGKDRKGPPRRRPGGGDR